MVAPERWRGHIEQTLSELGYTAASRREVWWYDLLLLPTFHAPGWVRVAGDGNETYAQIAFLQGSERFEDLVVVTEEAAAAFLGQVAATQPGALTTIDEGGRDGIVVLCWWQHYAGTFGFFAHNPTRAYHPGHVHVLDTILSGITESFRGDQTVQEYLGHIQRYLSH